MYHIICHTRDRLQGQSPCGVEAQPDQLQAVLGAQTLQVLRVSSLGPDSIQPTAIHHSAFLSRPRRLFCSFRVRTEQAGERRDALEAAVLSVSLQNWLRVASARHPYAK